MPRLCEQSNITSNYLKLKYYRAVRDNAAKHPSCPTAVCQQWRSDWEHTLRSRPWAHSLVLGVAVRAQRNGSPLLSLGFLICEIKTFMVFTL